MQAFIPLVLEELDRRDLDTVMPVQMTIAGNFWCGLYKSPYYPLLQKVSITLLSAIRFPIALGNVNSAMPSNALLASNGVISANRSEVHLSECFVVANIV